MLCCFGRRGAAEVDSHIAPLNDTDLSPIKTGLGGKQHDQSLWTTKSTNTSMLTGSSLSQSATACCSSGPVNIDSALQTEQDSGYSFSTLPISARQGFVPVTFGFNKVGTIFGENGGS